MDWFKDKASPKEASFVVHSCACMKTKEQKKCMRVPCIRVRMYEQLGMRTKVCVCVVCSSVHVCNQEMNTNLCARHAFMFACMNNQERKKTSCVSCVHVSKHTMRSRMKHISKHSRQALCLVVTKSSTAGKQRLCVHEMSASCVHVCLYENHTQSTNA